MPLEGIRCCVCHRYFSTEEIAFLGERPFCEPHRDRAIEATRTDWTRTGIIEAALLAAFVGAIALIWKGQLLPTHAGFGLLLAAIPAAIFLVFVYRQDRIEPEPVGVVLGVFALGALLGFGAVVPLEADVFAVDEWTHLGGPLAWAASSIGIAGTLHMLAVYVAVRYTVFQTTEFDEPIDGVVYAVAAGLGLATVDNTLFITQHDQVLPLAGAAILANTTLIDVACSALVGFGLARLRFEEGSTLAFLGTFLMAIVLHGGLHELVVVAGRTADGFDPLIGFGVTLGACALVLFAAQRLAVKLARAQLGMDDVGRLLPAREVSDVA